MTVFLLFVRLRLADLLRRRISGFFTLGMPMVLLLLLGVVFFHGHPFEQHRVALAAADNQKSNALTDALARIPGVRVQPEPTPAAALGQLRSRMVAAALVADGATARLYIAPSDEVFARGLVTLLTPAPTITHIEVSRWGYLHYLFPGLLTFTILIAGLYGTGYYMVRYRNNQFLRKLSTTPLPRSVFVASQITGRLVITLIQAILLTTCAYLVFALPLTISSASWLLVLSVLGLLVFLGAGFALACAFKSEESINDTIGAATMPLVLLSEIFFPTDQLPAPLPAISSALPSTQLVRLLRAVVLHGETSITPLLPGLAILCAWMIATYLLSLALFRWND